MENGLLETRSRTRDPNPALHESKIMATNIATAATSATLIPAAVQAVGGREYTDEEVRRLVAALEEPFDAQEIKWRVTNTTKDKSRGQVIAYADPRAYTDRLNAIFTVRGWTRKYAVQMINNVERKTSSESQIVGKVVVTCEVSIYGLGTHSGIGEEWADNENAGTAAEAQAFKRACACFGLGRYLYDVEGGWVDLDNRKQPKSTPKLPDWALPKRRTTNGAGQKSANQNGHAPQNRAAAQDAGTLRAHVQALAAQVGFSLSRSVLMAVAKVDTLEKVAANLLETMARKLEDTFRGVGRLRAAIAIVAEARYPELCKELNFASDHLEIFGSGSSEEGGRNSGSRSCSKDREAQPEIDCECRDGTSVTSSDGKGTWRNTTRVDQGSTARRQSPKNEGGGSGRQSGKRVVHLPANHPAHAGPHPGCKGGNGRPSQSHKLKGRAVIRILIYGPPQ
jgi:hypothetical protein